MTPTIDTNSPCSIESDTSSSTWRGPKDFETPLISMNGKRFPRSDGPQLRLRQAHEPVEGEANEADRQDREQDVGVHQAVVFLPEEPADARRARQHFGGNDDEPGDAEAEAVAGEDVRQRR